MNSRKDLVGRTAYQRSCCLHPALSNHIADFRIDQSDCIHKLHQKSEMDVSTKDIIVNSTEDATNMPRVFALISDA